MYVLYICERERERKRDKEKNKHLSINPLLAGHYCKKPREKKQCKIEKEGEKRQGYSLPGRQQCHKRHS